MCAHCGPSPTASATVLPLPPSRAAIKVDGNGEKWGKSKKEEGSDYMMTEENILDFSKEMLSFILFPAEGFSAIFYFKCNTTEGTRDQTPLLKKDGA